jgi:DNA repair protein RadC
MKRESLKTLGIEVSRNITAGELFRMTREELLTQDTADRINVLRELCEEFCEYKSREIKTVKSPGDAAKLMAHRLKCLDHEECWVLLLDMACHPIKKERITSGGASACIIDIPRIAKSAIIAGASGIILCHNHPSGCVNPSRSDLEQTGKLKKVLNQLGIVLNDHLIFADGRYFSFSDEKTSLVNE